MFFLSWACLAALPLVSSFQLGLTGGRIGRVALIPPPTSCLHRHSFVETNLYLAKKKKGGKRRGGKGFADEKPTSVAPSNEVVDTAVSESSTASSVAVESSSGTSSVEKEKKQKTTAVPAMNAGQRELARMRQQRVDRQDDELRKMKEVRSVDAMLREQPSASAIPEKVATRMGARMLPFVGIPLFGTMGAFVGFWYLRTYKDYEFEPSAVAFTTIGLLAVGLLGITYSILSASWDPDDDGSLLGLDEFGDNVDNLKDGLKRSRENALLRERMAGMPEDEIQRAIADLDRRDAQRAKK